MAKNTTLHANFSFLIYGAVGEGLPPFLLQKSLTAHYKYVYDGQGNIVRSIDILARKEYNYLYEDGKIMQSTESAIVLDECTNMVISKVFVCAVRYYYDTEDGLTKKHIKFADGKEFTENYEKTENDSQVVKFTAGGKTVISHSKNDSFGRKVFDELQLSTGFVSRQFTYLAGEVTQEHVDNNMLKSSPTTQLVSQIVLSGGRTISYEYDEEERITKVDDSVDGITEYTYDALGQLVTETKDSITTKFEYDNYGNILAKGVVDENGEISEATKITYEYGNEKWKDLLTSYNGQEIVYDEQGNPVNYLGHTLTWEKGRQLKSFDSIQYTYNANGIRTSKTVDGIRHDFVLEGAKILRETWENNTLVPLYDNKDSVCGIIYNGVGYFFLKNLQGDIIAITNSDGDTVARYAYDAWGKCTIDFDSTGHIADINPFRYRGYYFDQDINLYYLNSRYYDANTGRFINADSPEYVSIQGGNLFAYGGNCPTKNADYFGFCYTPTHSEEYASSTSYSYGKKKSGFDRDWLALGIDIVATLLMPYAVAPYDVIGNSLAWFAKNAGFTLVWNKLLTGVVPKVISIFGNFFTLIRTVIWRITGSIISNTVSLMISKLNGFLLESAKNETIKNLWILISMFFSFGSMIAGVLDFADGDFNGRISLFS